MSEAAEDTFDITVTLRRLKFTGPLAKSFKEIFLRFEGQKTIPIPPDLSNQRH